MGIMCSSGQVLIRAGKGVSNEFHSGAYIRTLDSHPVETLISGATALIDNAGRNTLSDKWSAINTNGKDFLRELCIDIAAIGCVIYDMNYEGGRVEAEDIINVLWDSKQTGLSILRDKKVQDFMNAA